MCALKFIKSYAYTYTQFCIAGLRESSPEEPETVGGRGFGWTPLGELTVLLSQSPQLVNRGHLTPSLSTPLA